MNQNQLNDVLQVISNIENYGVEKMPETIFKGHDITTIKVGEYNVPAYIVALKRMLTQLKVELAENGVYLPFFYSIQNEYGHGNVELLSELNALFHYLQQKSHAALDQSIVHLNRLIYFQITNGFWDKSKSKIHKADEIKLLELHTKLKIIAEQLSANQDTFTSQIEKLDLEKRTLADFLSQKQQELQQIANNLQTANTNTNQINQLLTTSTETKGKIEALLSQQKQNFDLQMERNQIIDTYFIKQKGIFDGLETNINEKVKRLETQITDFDEKLNFVESKKSFFEERIEYLQNLIGREVGASLFETFKQRKNELTKPVKNWRWIVIVMAALTFVAILTIFTNGFGWWGEALKEFTTISLITNTIKTFPFFYLLYYSISQYNKERNFQEEYAFKSAVALTIKAYADVIKEEKLKDEMIVSSVNAIYKSPIAEKGQSKKESNEIFETAKELLGTAVDILKNK